MRPRAGSEPQEQARRNTGAQSQIVPAEKKGRQRERKEGDNVRGEKEEQGGEKNPRLVEVLGRCCQDSVVKKNNA